MALEILGAIILQAGASVSRFMFSNITILLNFGSKISSLQEAMLKLQDKRNVIEEAIELGRKEGKVSAVQVDDWLKDAKAIELKVNSIMQDVANNERLTHGCNLGFTFAYRLSKKAAKKLEEVQQLINSGNFQIDTNPPVKAVERMPGPSIVCQKAASKMLRLLDHLNNETTERIAVWGMGGVGKTTLVKNLNNRLGCFSMEQPFDMVIWVPVSRNLNLRRIQSQIFERLNLEMRVGESMQTRAHRLFNRLQMEKKFLLILDDVWEKIDLDVVGIPQADNHKGCKIILTTRSLDVCREMKTDKEIKVDILNEEEAWSLFMQNAGNVVELEQIGFLARDVARECSGLPLAIKTVGASMRGKTKTELWKNALNELQKSAPYIESIEKEVYLPLKWSYDSLQGEIIKHCFLYCSLFPEDFSIKVSELIQCWIADGLLEEQQNLEESLNKGIALVETLKDCCMLEDGEYPGTVKMHDVVRDVAIWIASSEEVQTEFLIRSGIALYEMPEKMQKSFNRIALMNNKITRLPSRLMGCSALTTLLLQGNPLKKVPDGFFQEVRALRVLNLSGTQITSLPSSLLELGELRALFLRNCCSLEKLPQMGVLKQLQVLDLFGTRIKELPRGIGELSNLRELNLSRTHHLQNIQAGTVSSLYSLEALDMSFSAYMWDLKGKVEEGRATFEELSSLEHLSFLYIRLDNVACLDFDFAWLKRLKRFNIRICPRNCDSNFLPTQYDEKRVILYGVDLVEIGLEVLFSNATALDLATCWCISGLSELAAKRSMGGFVCLKSLTISNCDGIKNLIRGEEVLLNVLPNLEHLTFNRLKNFKTILDGMIPTGKCLRSLRTIEVVDCPRLKNLISYALLLQLRNVEEIRVSLCNRMNCMVAANVIEGYELPKLRILELKTLVNLRTICEGALACPSLERVEVSNCPLLEKLPFQIQNASMIREIRGDKRWWDRLKWEDDETKWSLQQCFQACTFNTELARVERWV